MKSVKRELYKLGTSLRPLCLMDHPSGVGKATPAAEAIQARVLAPQMWRVHVVRLRVSDEVRP